MIKAVAKARGITQTAVLMTALRKQHRGEVELGAERVIETALEIVPEIDRQFDEILSEVDDPVVEADLKILGAMLDRMIYTLQARIEH